MLRNANIFCIINCFMCAIALYREIAEHDTALCKPIPTIHVKTNVKIAFKKEGA